jgi:PadR family transcriptional regulator PadR
MRPLGELEHLLLLALLRLGDEAYGVSIRQEIESRTGRSLPTGAVYTLLGRLENKGLVSSHIGEPTAERGGRRKKFYLIRPAGERALAQTQRALRQMASGLEREIDALVEERPT